MKKCTPVLVHRGLAGLRANPGPGLLLSVKFYSVGEFFQKQ